MPVCEQRLWQLLHVQLDHLCQVVAAVDGCAKLFTDVATVDGGDQCALPALVAALAEQAFLREI